MNKGNKGNMKGCINEVLSVMTVFFIAANGRCPFKHTALLKQEY